MKKIYQIIFVTCLISIFIFKANAQEPRVYSQFFMNPFIYNPSYAGVEGHSVIFLMYRQQWTAINGGPTIGHVSFHTPLKNGIGIGGSIFNESQGIIDNVGVKGAVSYLLNIDKTHYLRFGMSLGVGTSTLNFDQLDDPTDPAFTNLVSDKLYSIGEFGMTYHTGHFNFGFALPSLLSYDVVSETDFSAVNVRPLDRALIKANYRGHISDDFAFEPHIIYRYSKNTLDQFEAAAIFHIKHIVWTGMSYRQNAGMIALFGTKVKESLGIGYAYELGKPGIANLTGNTHEIHIGYHIGSKKRHADHVSSFIKSHRLTAEERAAKAEQARLKMLETLAETEKEEEKPETIVAEQEKIPVQNTDNQGDVETNLDNNQRLPSITDTRILFIDEKSGEEKFVEKKTIKEVWVYEKPTSSQQVTRINKEGKVETAVVMTRETADGQKETIVDFIPVPDVGSKETWSIANPNVAPVERVNQKGEREIGIEWQKTDAQGNITNEMSWSKVYTGDTNSEEIINSVEGNNIPENSRVPVLNVQENLRPDEKVEELRIEFDNTPEGKNVKPTSNTITPQAQIVAKQENIVEPSKVNPTTKPDVKSQTTDTRILFVDEKSGEEKFVEKKSIKDVWVYQKPTSSQQVTRINKEGKVETAVVMTRETADGEKETIVDFIPVPEVGSKETWSIANPNLAPAERVNQKGEREIGIEWQKTDNQGNITKEMSWSKVYTGDTNSEEIINSVEGINIPENSRVPVLNVQENLRPDEKVEELRIEFDNTPEGKNAKPTSNTITPQAQIIAKQETNLNPSKESPDSQIDVKKQNVDSQIDPTKKPVVADNKSDDVKRNNNPSSNQIPSDTDKIDSYQRGTHLLELPAGHHIIAGAFENFQNAEDESDRIFGRGFTDVKVGYVSAKKLYYVVINTFDEVNKATNERNRIRKNPNFQKIWVLTIEN